MYTLFRYTDKYGKPAVRVALTHSTLEYNNAVDRIERDGGHDIFATSYDSIREAMIDAGLVK